MPQRPAIFILVLMLLSACSAPLTPTAAVPTIPPSTPSPTIIPAQRHTLTPLPSATPPSNFPDLQAHVWTSEPRVPIILYHRFLPDTYPESTPTKTRLGDFRADLQTFYDSGYSLVSLEDWLDGDLSSLPAGRRPLILTMDDAFFADQVFLDQDGNPSLRSGIGVLWKFSQEHPDFGFSAALFFNMGDKLYANHPTSTWFIVMDGWQEALGKAIAWCIDHDVMPYTHFYSHPRLDLTADMDIMPELVENDTTLRQFLSLAGREDLIPRLRNLIALPYSIWPQSQGGREKIMNYVNPEGEPAEAVLEAGYFYDEKTAPFVFSPEFDRFHIPRITTNTRRSIQFLADHNGQFPAAQECPLGKADPARLDDPDYLKALVQSALEAGHCPEGFIYAQNTWFHASADSLDVLKKNENSQP